MDYNYNLSILTPVHIGDGTSYTNKEYYTSNGRKSDGTIVPLLNRVDLNKYMMFLSSEEQDRLLYEIKKDDFKLDNIKDYRLYYSIEEFKQLNDDKDKHPTTIESTIKDINYRPFIPGSSIKGSIRTTIIYNFLDKERRLSSKEEYEEACKKPEITETMSKIIISDSSTTNNTIKTVQPLSITLKGKNDKARTDDGKKSGMYNALECIPLSKLDINIQLDNIDMDYIKECLYYFNYDYIEHEIEFYSKIDKKHEIIKNYKNLKGKNTKESPLIRIGGSTGLLSTTIGLHMKLNNLNLYKKTYIKDFKKYNEEYPKIRKITPKNMPFGWCKLNIKE